MSVTQADPGAQRQQQARLRRHEVRSKGHSHFSSSVWYVTGGRVWLTMSFVATAASSNPKSAPSRPEDTPNMSAGLGFSTHRPQTPVASVVMKNCVATTLMISFSYLRWSQQVHLPMRRSAQRTIQHAQAAQGATAGAENTDPLVQGQSKKRGGEGRRTWHRRRPRLSTMSAATSERARPCTHVPG